MRTGWTSSLPARPNASTAAQTLRCGPPCRGRRALPAPPRARARAPARSAARPSAPLQRPSCAFCAPLSDRPPPGGRGPRRACKTPWTRPGRSCAGLWRGGSRCASQCHLCLRRCPPSTASPTRNPAGRQTSRSTSRPACRTTCLGIPRRQKTRARTARPLRGPYSRVCSLCSGPWSPAWPPTTCSPEAGSCCQNFFFSASNRSPQATGFASWRHEP
mmetsp:Transcript_45388/g.115382  ORF Transcript_45388/g.115382 Transcript_45388/m.115382 type:complete len:217 (+) Transcript_45388:33-683(+)